MKKAMILSALACITALFIGCGSENNAARYQNRIGNVSDSYLTDGYWDKGDITRNNEYADRIVGDYASDINLYDDDIHNYDNNVLDRAGLHTNNRLGNSYHNTYRYNPVTKRYETLPYYDPNRSNYANVNKNYYEGMATDSPYRNTITNSATDINRAYNNTLTDTNTTRNSAITGTNATRNSAITGNTIKARNNVTNQTTTETTTMQTTTNRG